MTLTLKFVEGVGSHTSTLDLQWKCVGPIKNMSPSMFTIVFKQLRFS
jgi:hypothetical protein